MRRVDRPPPPGPPVAFVTPLGRLTGKGSGTRGSLWRRGTGVALPDLRPSARGLGTETLEELEDRLLAADFGVEAALRLVDRVEALQRRGRLRGPEALRNALRDEVAKILLPVASAGGAPAAPATEAAFGLREPAQGIAVYLMVGVNGVGKTTSAGKLAHVLAARGRKILLAAADTYRAGAISQLRIWADRTGADFVAGQPGGDPAAVAFDAIDAARARGVDVAIVDTAGRLHTRTGLMDELAKVRRVIARKLPGAPHETLIVLDATVGQNALAQVRVFRDAVNPSGILLAKMDSSARGGIVVALGQEFGLPVKLVGVGEGPGDLEPFDANAFLEGVFGSRA
ncbi:MAG: signal recognition particle-docking protein FtsY [Gammaproteobacteria bacterium]|nr:signal recognition particle-docking protein FtsY [Gammaproteobacteria bacterium]